MQNHNHLLSQQVSKRSLASIEERGVRRSQIKRKMRNETSMLITPSRTSIQSRQLDLKVSSSRQALSKQPSSTKKVVIKQGGNQSQIRLSQQQPRIAVLPPQTIPLHTIQIFDEDSTAIKSRDIRKLGQMVQEHLK